MSVFATWAKCRQYILPALEHAKGTHSEDDLVVMLLQGKLKLWQMDNAAMITEIAHYPRIKATNVFLAGGALSELQALENTLLAYARSEGCSRVTFTARPGWTRIFNDVHSMGLCLYRDI
jgi:hypothetical protein